MIQPSIDALFRARGAGRDKRNNITNVLSNLKSVIFDGIYLNYEDVTKSRTTDTPKTKESDMPNLESEESAEQRRNQPGRGLKVLTRNQMLSRLPIS